MSKTCQAIAKSSGTQCKMPARRGSSYCAYHFETTPAFVSGVVGAVLGLVLSLIWSSFVPSREFRELSALRESRQETLAENRALSSKVDEQISGNERLLQENKRLLQSVAQYQSQLEERDNRIVQLEQKAKLAQKGVATTFTFNGQIMESSRPGHLNLIEETPEFREFPALAELVNSRRYDLLIPRCLELIDRNPEWLTPYFFLGAAYASTGERAKAIEALEHVVANAPSDPDYEKAREFLKKLKRENSGNGS